MIRFTLSCKDGHRFESWFASNSAFDSLSAAGHVTCAVCGSTQVEKSLMAPAVRTDEEDRKRPSLSAALSPQEQAAADLRRKVEENADYVGLSFAKEARAIHDGDAPARAIYGEAKLDEARKLLEDGIPVAPLPFMPKAKTN
ncbi:DUF1178 family protein [Flavimaricola marinus]|uniref:DUF1178 family protein n=1 Tax=Flavimaricola marinus TaxID=1819565 RepID=A0A238LC85_9RHOB|nr:DUF1178 family protein [Flavimaricola marinus]SMY06556.1 hypothetical protein LOM8899_00683 [Flavimaricola marinus]